MQFPYPVVLASASPRRRELLSQLGIEFKVVPADIDEDNLTVDDPDQTARRLAREKALHVFAQNPESLVIGADTVVSIDNDGGTVQLAKPTDEPDAGRILSILSGRTHVVTTGVCIKWPGGMNVFAERSEVTFRKLEENEIAEYIATGEPMDKAGAYGLQGKAKGFVAAIRGNHDNVIGLPMDALREALREIR